MTLCEVSLGEQYERLAAEYEAAKSMRKAKKQSTWGKGRTAPDPSGTVELPGSPGVQVPMGKGVPSGIDGTSLLYNEYIAYGVACNLQLDTSSSSLRASNLSCL